MLTVCALTFFSVVYTASNPLRSSYGKDKHLKEDVISNLELLIPLKENEHHKNKRLKDLRGTSSGNLGDLSDGSYSAIPNSEFVLDDAAAYFKGLQKTTKKDLSQADPQSQKNNNLLLSNGQSPPKDNKSSEGLLQKCRKYLEVEHLRSQWESVLNRPLVYEASHSEDQELLLGLCRIQLGLRDKNREQQTPARFQSMWGKLGGGGQGGVGGNAAVNEQGGVAGNMGGKSDTRDTEAETARGDSIAFKILNGMGFNSGNLAIDGQGGFAGNAGFNGEGGTTGNVGIGGKGGQAGNLGVGGKGGIVGNLGTGGHGGIFGNVGIGSNSNQYFDFFSGFGQGNINPVPGHQNQAPEYKGVKKISFAYPAMNQALGFGQKGNDMHLGLGGSSVSHSGVGSGLVGDGERPGNVGVGGESSGAGIVVVGEAGPGQGGNLGNLYAEGEANEGHMVFGKLGAVPNIVVPSQANTGVSQNLKQVARNDNRLDQNNVQCYVGSLAHGGKGGQIGNLAISGGASKNSHYPSCGHAPCILIYLVLYPKEARGGGSSWPLPLVENPKAAGAGEARQNGFRRGWMMLDGKIDPRLQQYIDNRKPWISKMNSSE